MIKLLLSLVICLCVVAIPVRAHAYDALSVNCSGSTGSSAVCNHSANDPLTGSDGLLAKIANIVSYIAGAAAVILIIVSGIRYITAGGDSQTISSAKNTLIGALVGLVIIFLARALITFVVTQL